MKTTPWIASIHPVPNAHKGQPVSFIKRTDGKDFHIGVIFPLDMPTEKLCVLVEELREALDDGSIVLGKEFSGSDELTFPYNVGHQTSIDTNQSPIP